uniref:Uncharacterized protein n=1 Tax=Fibrocapsa japonica TaxID=94617 RepID=A0A7S2V550_9STRA|mmetsp:Transcript_4858/g.7303  ORF Transcript_4858/g.7303 Transcript_4858/m.7303 type:complete len:292 (+) Transcript_4858:54-929(+)
MAAIDKQIDMSLDDIIKLKNKKQNSNKPKQNQNKPKQNLNKNKQNQNRPNPGQGNRRKPGNINNQSRRNPKLQNGIANNRARVAAAKKIAQNAQNRAALMNKNRRNPGLQNQGGNARSRNGTGRVQRTNQRRNQPNQQKPNVYKKAQNVKVNQNLRVGGLGNRTMNRNRNNVRRNQSNQMQKPVRINRPTLVSATQPKAKASQRNAQAKPQGPLKFSLPKGTDMKISFATGVKTAKPPTYTPAAAPRAPAPQSVGFLSSRSNNTQAQPARKAPGNTYRPRPGRGGGSVMVR